MTLLVVKIKFGELLAALDSLFVASEGDSL